MHHNIQIFYGQNIVKVCPLFILKNGFCPLFIWPLTVKLVRTCTSGQKKWVFAHLFLKSGHTKTIV
jgi:hypothetical protein